MSGIDRVVVDTNVLSFILKRDSRSRLYVPRIGGKRHGLPLMTHNPSHFQHISGLAVIAEAE